MSPYSAVRWVTWLFHWNLPAFWHTILYIFKPINSHDPIPFSGYFSLVNEKGQATAAAYSKVIELVRERVYKFLTLENMVAYNESFSEGESPVVAVHKLSISSHDPISSKIANLETNYCFIKPQWWWWWSRGTMTESKWILPPLFLNHQWFPWSPST